MKIFIIFFFFAFCWIIMSGIFDPLFIFFGFFSCSFVMFISYLMGVINPAREMKYSSFILYCFWLLKEILVSSFVTMRLIIFNREVNPVIISFKPNCKRDFQLMLLSNSITLTPGTVSILVSMDRIVIHALNQDVANSVHAINEKIGQLV